jgi:hypothetical protein
VTGGVFWHPTLIINRPQTLSVFNSLFIANFLLDFFWYSKNSLRNTHAKVANTRRLHYQGLQPVQHAMKVYQESQPRFPTGLGLQVQIRTDDLVTNRSARLAPPQPNPSGVLSIRGNSPKNRGILRNSTNVDFGSSAFF